MFLTVKSYRDTRNIYYLQKIISLCSCKYCFKIRIIYITIVYIARVKASVNGNSIRNTFTDCIHEMYIYCACLRFSLILFPKKKLNFRLSYPNLGINIYVNHKIK